MRVCWPAMLAGRTLFAIGVALAAPFLLVFIALCYGNDETPIVVGDASFVVRPLTAALVFAAIDAVLIAILWFSGILPSRF